MNGKKPEADKAVDGMVEAMVDLAGKVVDAVGWVAMLNILRTVACNRQEPYIDGILQGTAGFIKSRNADGIPLAV